MDARIAVVGSLNMDLVARSPRIPAPGETIIGHGWHAVPGGKGANQAIAAARLGAKVAMIGRVGTDSFAQALLDTLQINGVDHRHITADPETATGVALIVMDDTGQNSIVVASGANAEMSAMPQVSRFSFLRFKEIDRIGDSYVRTLAIRTPTLRQRIRNLSGGNQQKVIIARWLTLQPTVLILDEPTRGIDVGAKAEIHALMRQLAAQGVAVVMISSELHEVLGVSDRIVVMHEGRIKGEFSRTQASEDVIMRAATGATRHEMEPLP